MSDRKVIPSSTEEYSRAIARVAVAQLAERERFSAMQSSAVEVLADLLIRYINEICSSSDTYARDAGRSEINIYDVLLSLDDLGQPLDELQKYAQSVSDKSLEFAHPVPLYPIFTQPKQQPVSFEKKGEAPPPHIPAWLPAFPDQHTYKSTAVFQGRQDDQKAQRQVVAEAQQQAERALIKLHKRLVSTASLRDNLDPSAAAENPYLAPPVFEVLPAEPAAEAEAGTTAAGAAARAAAAAQQQQQQPVKVLMPILDDAAQKVFNSVTGDAVPEGLTEAGMHEYVGWVPAPMEEDGGALPPVSSLEPAEARRQAAVSFSIRRREDAFAGAEPAAAPGRRSAHTAARRRAESILMRGPFAMEMDERELDG